MFRLDGDLQSSLAANRHAYAFENRSNRRNQLMKPKHVSAMVLFGCAAVGLFSLPISYASGPDAPAKVVTFNKDVAPIFHAKCAECHHPGEAAPFSTLTYKDARPWAKSIKEKVINHEMPPWHADP